jgi:hypothetical protein
MGYGGPVRNSGLEQTYCCPGNDPQRFAVLSVVDDELLSDLDAFLRLPAASPQDAFCTRSYLGCPAETEIAGHVFQAIGIGRKIDV